MDDLLTLIDKPKTNKPKMFSVPIMPKGARIYWKGDLVCVATRDCWPGDPMIIDDFIWYRDKPEPGDEVHPALQDYLNARIKAVVTASKSVDYNEGR